MSPVPGSGPMGPGVVDLAGPQLRVRLTGATAADVAAVRARLGIDVVPGPAPDDAPADPPAGGAPDILVRYEATGAADHVTVTSGRSTELHHPRGSGCPEVLVPLAALAALHAGAVPVHGSAFAFGRRAMVVTGTSGTGKTGVLLRALARGAGLVAAEHVLLGEGGDIAGRREAVRLRPRHRRELTPSTRALTRRLAFWNPVTSLVTVLYGRGGPVGWVGRRLQPRVRDRAVVDLPPGSFPAASGPIALDSLIVLLPSAVPTPEIVAIAPEDAAARLGVMFRDEMGDLSKLAGAITFRTGTPDASELAEAEQRYRAAAAALLVGRRLLLVQVPPAELSAAHAAQIVEHLLSHFEEVSE